MTSSKILGSSKSTSDCEPAASTAPTSLLLAGTNQARPFRPTPYLVNDGGPEKSDTTAPAARDLLTSWRPHAPTTLTLLQPGWAGLQPFRATDASGRSVFVKLCMVDAVGARASAEKRRAVAEEAQRAKWAGVHGVGPKVLFVDEERGGLVTEWIDSTAIGDDEIAGPLLPAFARAARQVHAIDPTTLSGVPPGDVHWLDQLSLGELWAKQSLGLGRGQLDVLQQLGRGIATLTERCRWRPVPIHNDLHRRNALRAGDGLTLVDWANLKLGDPMVDLGHIAAFADVPVDRYGHLLRSYGGATAIEAQGEAIGPVERLTLRATHFDLRACAFMAQWSGPLPSYLLGRVDRAAVALAPMLRRELGLQLAAPAVGERSTD